MTTWLASQWGGVWVAVRLDGDRRATWVPFASREDRDLFIATENARR